MRDGSDTNVPDGRPTSGAPAGSMHAEADAARVIAAEHVARAHLARELHDVPVQALSAAQWQLEAMSNEVEEPIRARLQIVAASLGGAQRYLRELMARLDPPGLASEGLAIAVADLLEETYGAPALGSFDAGELNEPSVGTGSVMFRVVHDAVTSRCTGQTVSADGLTVLLRDDGDGVLLRLDDHDGSDGSDGGDDCDGNDDHATGGTGATLAVAMGGWWRRSRTDAAPGVTRTECWLPRW